MICIDSNFDEPLESEKKKDDEEKESFFDNFKKFNKNFWILFLWSFSGFCSILGFHVNQSKFYQLHYGFSLAEAGKIISINGVLCSIITPLIGIFLSKSKDRMFWLRSSAVGLILSNCFYAFSPKLEKSSITIIPTLVISVCQCLIVVLFPTIVRDHVPKDQFSKAMVVFKTNEKLSYMFNPTIIGIIIDNTILNSGFFGVSILLTFYGFIMLFWCLCVSNEDSQAKEKIS